MIISASRRTDIPAYFTEWFFNRIKDGFVYVRNPMHPGRISKVSLSKEHVDCFVFWTKNPGPFIKRLSELSEYHYYFLFTVNSYGSDLEPGVPRKKDIIETFTELSKKIGKERVIWRYDPILLSDKYTIDYHIKYFRSIAERLSPFTEKCVISFIDLYKKCKRNLKDTTVRELSADEIHFLSPELKKIADEQNLSLHTCAETMDLSTYGMWPNRCVDNVLIERLLNEKIKSAKDKNQRKECGCIESIDIGAYNTCKHGCLYCYANINNGVVSKNCEKHSVDSPLLFGEVVEKDIITERKVKSIATHTLFG
ncbi:DUF1848 domain-containing protein [Marinilabilia rubra]|uniref:DUF1848 domain-containing protein n=1 Tax=Marinilabilia rubra TaxID=2162893 RepID=A0A2U2B8F0_9BACT|nr:DUF1848 domain-containing protein [Marinilabilia rubra]PWD99337.1 hypothetical protein DDZ16_10005 [Marinilabilia rubra]